MPTGYTAQVIEGVSFKKFVLQCARAFGACVTMRDEANDKEIPVFKVSSYHSDNIKKVRERLATLKGVTLEVADMMTLTEFNNEVKYNEEHIAERGETKAQYLKMLSLVREWQPPTPEHVSLKDFMIQQLEGSIKSDCSISYYTDNPPKLLTGREWLSKEINASMRSIAYHEEELAEEAQRVEGRNLWVSQLKESLK